MMPVVWTIPGINYDIPAFGLMMMIGFLGGIIWAAKRAAKSGANPDVVLNCGFFALIGGVVGCRAMFVAHNWDAYVQNSGGNAMRLFMDVINVTRGGMEFYGGFILSVGLVFAYLLVKRHSLRWYFDIIAPSVAVGMAFGRVGCFLNGCCHGGTCEVPWAITFPPGSPAAVEQWENRKPGAELPKELIFTNARLIGPVSRDSLRATEAQINTAEQEDRGAIAKLSAAQAQLSEAEKNGNAADTARLKADVQDLQVKAAVAQAKFADIRYVMHKFDQSAAAVKANANNHRSLPVHPAQLYSTITLLIIAWVLSAVYWRRTRDGQVIFLFFVIEPITRWLLETVRADNPTDMFWGMTISQAMAAIFTPIGLLGLLWIRTLPPRSRNAALWEPPEEETAAKKAKSKAGTPATV